VAPNRSIGDVLSVRILEDISAASTASLGSEGSTLLILMALLAAGVTRNRLAVTAVAAVLLARAAALVVARLMPEQAPLALLLIDAALLAAMLSLAVFSRPCWILFAAAFQLLEFGTRTLSMIFPGWPAEPPLQFSDWALALALMAGSLGRLTECRLLSRDRRSPLM
jgi:hypothetical protein